MPSLNRKNKKKLSYLDELNGPQREAVEYVDGPALVIAGAGSGKTRVLTYKIMHLLECGYKPWNILAITFTNKAAREMKSRIAAKIGQEKAAQLFMGTFHSIFMRILRIEADKTGYQSNFTIYDQTDAKSVIKGILKDMKLDEKSYPTNEICSKISNAKNHLITAEQYEASPMYAEDIGARKPLTSKIYMQYMRKCKAANAMDFDDLLLQMHFLLANHPDMVKKYSEKFKYILVDEYQDTNSVQYNIVKALGSLHHKVFVVGDDAQSIYSFRGAQIENILNFQKDYKEAKLFKLEQNYRSTQTIVNAANAVILQNRKQIQKDTFSENELGDKIRILESQADNEEGYIIAAEIAKAVSRNQECKYKDFALLYRTNAQSRILEESLRKRAIPYKIFGGMSFYQRKEIKDMIAYLRLMVNGNDDEAFKRVVNYPKRGIGETTVDKISTLASENSLSIWNTVVKIKELDNSISPRTINAISNFMKLLYQLKLFSQNADAYQSAMQAASASGMLKELNSDKTPEGVSRYENLHELLNGIKSLVETRQKETGKTISLAEYLEEVSLMTGDEANEGDDNMVTLMTIHSAKGLEFKNVFITGVEEGLFPSAKSIMSQTELEEERRLFYVAVTRAEKKLTISFARMRYKWGQLTPASPSRFIKEIDPRYLDFGVGGESLFEASDMPFHIKRQKTPFLVHDKLANATIQPGNLKRITNSSNTGFGGFSKFSEIESGKIVEHGKFGKGKVVATEGTGLDMKATIDFASVGRKTLLVKHAKLKVIG